MGEESSMFTSMEDLEAFLGSVPHKIEQALCSEDADLGTLAERLVGLCVHALLVKHGKIAVRYFECKEAEDASGTKLTCELSNILLRKPKELVLKYRGSDSASVHRNKTQDTVHVTKFESILCFSAQSFPSIYAIILDGISFKILCSQ